MSSILRDLLCCNFSQLLEAWKLESKSLCTTLLFGGGIGLLAVARFAWNDYKVYMGYGPGGLPYNMYGWFVSSCILRPMSTNVFSTAQYDKLPDKRSWLGVNWPGGRTRGPQRPKLGPHPLPQRQLNQLATPEIHKVTSHITGTMRPLSHICFAQNLVKAFDAVVAANSNLIQFRPSKHEGHTDAIFVADSITKSSIVDQMLGEVSHIHGTGDHSVHVVLAPQDCKLKK